MNIQWYPGHMAKTRRMLEENLKAIDVVVELVDARAPIATRNPSFEKLFSQKQRLLLLNKSDLADPAITKKWLAHFKAQGINAMSVSCTGDKSLAGVILQIETIMRPKVEQMRQKGVRKTVRAMVVGIPNCGKSTFINKLRGKSAAKASDKPGVTRGKQWIIMGPYLEFLDTPGMLWPKFEDKSVAQKLAYIGAVRDDIMDVQELACGFLSDMAVLAPNAIKERFHLSTLEGTGWDLLQDACRGRGWILSGGRLNTERGASVILDEFRAGKLGKLSLEAPEASDAQE